MIAAAAFLLLFQADPRIEKVEPILGNVNRPYHWTPLSVTVASDGEFDGDIVARSGFGFGVARRLTLKAGGRTVVLLPALNPEEIVVGRTRFKMPEKFIRPERIVIVDARLPYAEELVSTEKIHFQKMFHEDLEKTLPRGLLEAADLVLVKEPLGSGVVAKTREEADRAVAALKEPMPALELMDRSVWPLAPQQRWVPAKRNWTVYFATVYAFAAFVALTVVAKRFPRFGLACLAGVAVLGMAGFYAFPRSHLWIVGHVAEVVPPVGEAQEQRIWFVQSALEMTAGRIEFPRLVKPIFPSRAGADDAFTIRVHERGSWVEGLKLAPGRAACFGGVEGRPPSPRGALHSAVVVRGGRVRFLGPLAAAAPVPAEAGEGGVPPGTEFEAWKRFVGNDGLFGVVEGDAASAGQVQSPDLVDEVERPQGFHSEAPVIDFDVIETPVGPCTVEMEDGRLTRLHLGPCTVESGRRKMLKDARRWVADWFRGRSVEVPMKLEGTPFTRRVYEIVRRIPAGKTRSYGEVADAAGRPGAARAVGAAMAKNRICLFIPCHRVVGSTGLGGWSGTGGLAQKQALLDLERGR